MYVKAHFAQLFGDVVIGHGAEQAAIHTGFLCQFDSRASEFFAYGLSGSQLLGSQFFEFGTACFKLFHSGFGCAAGAASRDQEVAGVAVFDFDDITEVAQVEHFVEQNDLHGWCLLRSCAGQ